MAIEKKIVSSINIRILNMKNYVSLHAVLISLVAGLLLNSPAQAQTVQKNTQLDYKDVFISYYSPDNVAAMADFAEQKQLGGFILWEFRGDMPFNDKRSLLAKLPSVMNGSAPLVMGYWTNWSVYTDTNKRAIPQPAYRVPGSFSGDNDVPVANDDFTQKLEGMNAVTYAFLQAQTILKSKPGEIGKLYFNDPWADLHKPGKSLKQDGLCTKDASICDFALDGATLNGAQMGNFNAFSDLKHNVSNPLGPLKKIISVAGYGHDTVFEDTFTNSTYINNFVTSAKLIIDSYGIDGIDLDYENPAMTQKQSRLYLDLIKALRKQLPGKFISVTILVDPDFIKVPAIGEQKRGFAPGVLFDIANQVDHINLMTYDFHGAFDYTPDGKGTTGFLTNLHMPDPLPYGYRFSVNTSVQAALDERIPAKKLSIGIPAYGRALTGIAANNGGLFQAIKASSVGIPKGDLDAAACASNIPLSTSDEPCSGSFRYNYILNNMVGHGFVETTHKAQGVSNGITAYATRWAPPQQVSHKLTIVNNSSADVGVSLSNKDHSFTTPFYIKHNSYEDYEPASIANQKDLAVNLAWWQGPTQCANLDFTSDIRIAITMSSGTLTCAYSN